jgi:hypothetical protein
MSQMAIQGKVYAYSRDENGNPIDGIYVGFTESATLDLSISNEEYVEADSGNSLTAARITTEKKTNFNMDMRELDADTAQLVLHGTLSAVAPGTVTDEPLGASVTVGRSNLLEMSNVSGSVVVVDSTPSTPKTLPSGQYAWSKQGSLIVLDKTTGGPYVEPFLVSYAHLGTQDIAIFNSPQPERWIRIEGINLADNNRPVTADIYRVALDPAQSFPLKSRGLASYRLAGGALLDGTKPVDGDLGQFGRIRLAA